MSRVPESSLTWSTARTLNEIGELTARWLEGAEPHQPGYDGGPHPETTSLIPLLAAANRAGFVTQFSQPGGRWSRRLLSVWEQRAAVSGFCTQETWRQLFVHQTSPPLEHPPPRTLVSIAARPGASDDQERVAMIRTGRIRRHPQILAGDALPPDELRELYTELGPVYLSEDGLAALTSAYQVTLYDSQWGNANGELWSWFGDALGIKR